MLRLWKNSELEKKLFWIGIFFLPSILSFSFIVLFLSLMIMIIKYNKAIIFNKINIFFILNIFLIIISCFFHSNQIFPLINKWEESYSWIGIANWVPQIICFLGFQKLLTTSSDREIFGKIIIAGTFPILISGFLQYYLGIYGPYDFLNGFIVWFQRPISPNSGLTSIFSNQNYAGSWFCIVLPFSIAAFLINIKTKIRKYISIFFLISISTSLILTTSRNAWGGLILLIPLITGINSLIWLIPLIFVVSLLISSAVFTFIPFEIQSQIREFLPDWLWLEFSASNFNSRPLRVDIWSQALNFIFQKPFFGWGASTFPILFYSVNETYISHPHNLIFELAISYGIPVAILLFLGIFLICLLSFFKIFRKNNIYEINYFERAWFASFFVLFCSQILDIQYFDGRISLVFWLLLSGLKELIENKTEICS